MAKNADRKKLYLDAVDIVCMDCDYCEESVCCECPVRLTVAELQRNQPQEGYEKPYVVTVVGSGCVRIGVFATDPETALGKAQKVFDHQKCWTFENPNGEAVCVESENGEVVFP